MAFVDPLRIEQMVSNLVANAVQHGTASGKVAATVVGTTESIEIAVHNEAPPIPQDRLDTVFTPFIRLEAQQRDHHGHLGLGLFIAREIAVAHGGTLTVESNAESGTTFTATIPRNRRRASDPELRTIGRRRRDNEKRSPEKQCSGCRLC